MWTWRLGTRRVYLPEAHALAVARARSNVQRHGGGGQVVVVAAAVISAGPRW